MKPVCVHQPVILESIRDMYSAQHSAIYLTQRLLWSQIYNTQAHRTWALLGARLCALAGPAGQHVLRAPRWPGAAPARVGNMLSGRQPLLLCARGSPRHSRRASSSRRPALGTSGSQAAAGIRPAPGLTRPLTSQPSGPSIVGWAPFPARSAHAPFPARSAHGWALHRRHVCGYKRSILVLCMGGVQAPLRHVLLHARARCNRVLCVNTKCGARGQTKPPFSASTRQVS